MLALQSKVHSPGDPQTVGSEPRDGEQDSHKDGHPYSGGPGSMMKYLGKTEEDRHSESGEDGAGGVNQAAEGVSAKDNFDSQCLGRKGEKRMANRRRVPGSVQKVT